MNVPALVVGRLTNNKNETIQAIDDYTDASPIIVRSESTSRGSILYKHGTRVRWVIVMCLHVIRPGTGGAKR